MQRVHALLSRRTVPYILSGILSFAVENATFLFLYYLLSRSPRISNIGSIAVALVVNFFVSKFFVFQNKQSGRSSLRQGVMYLVVVVANTLISTLIVVRLINAGLPGYIVKPAVTLLIVSWTYIIYKKIIFKTPGIAQPDY